MQRFIVRAAAWALLGLAAASSAHAQTSVQRTWTTYVVHGVSEAPGERTAQGGEPLVRQPVTATRGARLEEETASHLGMGLPSAFPAGTRMFGVKVPDGWMYCAVASASIKFFFSDTTACYQDIDGDGAFEIVRNSGPPFSGVPLFVLQPGPPVRLAKPARYSEIPYADGPRVEIGLVARPVKAKGAGAPTSLTVTRSILHNGQTLRIHDPVTVDLAAGPQTIEQDGAVIRLLGLNPDGAVRYEIEKPMPTQIQPIELVLTTSTYYYIMSY